MTQSAAIVTLVIAKTIKLNVNDFIDSFGWDAYFTNSFFVKCFLPRSLLLSGLAQERRERTNAQETFVQPVPRLLERAREINEQHHAIAIRVVPYFVIERVVEDQRFACRPVAKLVADTDAHFLARLRHEQGEVKAQHTVVSAAMRGDVLVR